MTNTGPPILGDQLLQVEAQADEETVRALTTALLRALNEYLNTSENRGYLEVLMALVNFWRLILSDQADQMALSPEQRASLYQVSLRSLAAALDKDVARAQDAGLVTPRRPQRPRRRPR